MIGSSVKTGTSPDTVIYNSTVKKAVYSIQVTGASNSTYNANNCYSLKAESSATAYLRTAALPEMAGSLGINSTSTQNGFWRLYPIPANSEVNIYYNSSENEKAELQIIDAVGRMISGKTVDIRTGSNTFQMDTHNLSKGIYLIKLILPKEVLTGKVIIEKK